MPAAPTLTAPASGATITGNSVTFSWNPSSGATYYYLCVIKASDGSLLFNRNVGNVTSSTQPGFPNDGTQYRWGVAACNSAGFTSSAFQNFTNGP